MGSSSRKIRHLYRKIEKLKRLSRDVIRKYSKLKKSYITLIKRSRMRSKVSGTKNNTANKKFSGVLEVKNNKINLKKL